MAQRPPVKQSHGQLRTNAHIRVSTLSTSCRRGKGKSTNRFETADCRGTPARDHFIVRGWSFAAALRAAFDPDTLGTRGRLGTALEEIDEEVNPICEIYAAVAVEVEQGPVGRVGDLPVLARKTVRGAEEEMPEQADRIGEIYPPVLVGVSLSLIHI